MQHARPFVFAIPCSLHGFMELLCTYTFYKGNLGCTYLLACFIKPCLRATQVGPASCADP
jgi:hypothetical protein